MIGLCVFSNCTTIFFLIIDRLELKEFHRNNQTLEAILMGFAILGWYGVQNVIYWLFGFKYWVISIEMPLILNAKNDTDEERQEMKKKKFWTEKRYRNA